MKIAIRKARAWMPDAAIGADVMTGFPGETDDEFEESRAFIAEPAVHLSARVHLFGAAGNAGGGQPSKSRWKCAAIATGCCASWPRDKNLEFRRRMLGRTLSVVTLNEGALSDNFLKVELATPRAANQLIDVKIGSLTANGLREHNALTVL